LERRSWPAWALSTVVPGAIPGPEIAWPAPKCPAAVERFETRAEAAVRATPVPLVSAAFEIASEVAPTSTISVFGGRPGPLIVSPASKTPVLVTGERIKFEPALRSPAPVAAARSPEPLTCGGKGGAAARAAPVKPSWPEIALSARKAASVVYCTATSVSRPRGLTAPEIRALVAVIWEAVPPSTIGLPKVSSSSSLPGSSAGTAVLAFSPMIRNSYLVSVLRPSTSALAGWTSLPLKGPWAQGSLAAPVKPSVLKAASVVYWKLQLALGPPAALIVPSRVAVVPVISLAPRVTTSGTSTSGPKTSKWVSPARER
jgi:hypothetical protein